MNSKTAKQNNKHNQNQCLHVHQLWKLSPFRCEKKIESALRNSNNKSLPLPHHHFPIDAYENVRCWWWRWRRMAAMNWWWVWMLNVNWKRSTFGDDSDDDDVIDEDQTLSGSCRRWCIVSFLTATPSEQWHRGPAVDYWLWYVYITMLWHRQWYRCTDRATTRLWKNAVSTGWIVLVFVFFSFKSFPFV